MAFRAGHAFVDFEARGLRQMSTGVSRLQTKFSGLRKSAMGIGSAIKRSFGGLGDIAKIALGTAAGAGIQRLVSGLAQIPRTMIDANASMERFRTQFEVLLGSSSAAKKRMAELAEFANTTPFQLPDIVEASRLLQTFGGDALATGENLRMVGDLAAGSGAEFASTAMWIGRLKDAIDSGRPFGEAAARLQELGILSGEARNHLEDMSKAGMDGADIWAQFRDEVARFDGMMAKQSRTFSGLVSTIKDKLVGGLRDAGKPLFDVAKRLAEQIVAGFDAIPFDKIGATFGRLIELAVAFGRAVLNGLAPLGQMAMAMLGIETTGSQAFETVNRVLEDLIFTFRNWDLVAEGIGIRLAELAMNAQGVLSTMWTNFKQAFSNIGRLVRESIAAWIKAFFEFGLQMQRLSAEIIAFFASAGRDAIDVSVLDPDRLLRPFRDAFENLEFERFERIRLDDQRADLNRRMAERRRAFDERRRRGEETDDETSSRPTTPTRRPILEGPVIDDSGIKKLGESMSRAMPEETRRTGGTIFAAATDFARSIQEAASRGRDDKQDRIAKSNEQIRDRLGEMLRQDQTNHDRLTTRLVQMGFTV